MSEIARRVVKKVKIHKKRLVFKDRVYGAKLHAS
jgi:hypothetical protein